MRARRFTQIAASGALLLAIAACGSTNMTATTAATTSPNATSTATATGEFGPGCAAMPTDPANPGSFDAMGKQPVVTAASGNPQLEALVAAVTAAGVGEALNSAQDITVFAPTNDAFAKIPAADLQALLADKTMLTKVLSYHVVPGRLAPDQLAGTHKTLEGQELTVTGSGTDFTVNDTAAVVCGNVQTQNATVYIVDGALMPPS